MLIYKISYLFISRVSQALWAKVRVIHFRMLGMKLGKKNRFEKGRIRQYYQISIGDNNYFTEGWSLWPFLSECKNPKIIIGDGNYFNKGFMIDSCNKIEIGSENMFGPDVYITDSNHSFGIGINPKRSPMKLGKTVIGNFCWIGAKSIILKDVELGDYCVVAAGAVVTKSFPSGSVIAGIPAKKVNN